VRFREEIFLWEDLPAFVAEDHVKGLLFNVGPGAATTSLELALAFLERKLQPPKVNTEEWESLDELGSFNFVLGPKNRR